LIPIASAFARAARETGAYVFAGSLFGPLIDEEPARGLHPAPGPAHNWLAVFSPSGRVLARVPKLRLVADERKALLRPGRFGPHVLTTRIGRLGVLVCLDAFHEALVERVDAAGAWLLVQPSANAAAWFGPWSADGTQVEGEVWLREGLARKLEGRENLRYGLNPMLNGSLYELRFEGRSSVAAAGRYLALADEPTGDAIVRAVVERPAAPG
jgi:predicted amidohydrolase